MENLLEIAKEEVGLNSSFQSRLMSLQIGEKAPDFTLPDQDGKQVQLSSFKGQRVIIYFYPKDDTPGCTKEACNFRDR